MSQDIAQCLPNLARQHAESVRPRKRGGKWSWTDARARAPWSRELPAEHEDAFRDAYAGRLVELGLALPLRRSRTSGATPDEATRAARGDGRITLRMPQVTITLLRAQAAAAEQTVSDYVGGLVERADRES